ncbi:Anaphase-promoting complex subunit 4-like protein [Cladobotryum mycophilum]|uniref:Anaphase-promoting complex subunit 4 n=1 Tax=Cladobotryum mycophilum TaxID=491253 RepID=A0ABR0SBZ0_9HYPO
MAQAKELSLYSETEFEVKAPNGFPVSCPTVDLAATWDPEGRDLLIYRPSSQVVSKIHQVAAPGEKAPEVRAVTWKPDGQFLALGWSDGVVRLMGLENNKAAHHIPVSEKSEATITHIGWSTSVIADKSRSKISSHIQDEISKHWAAGEEKAPLNLPQELTFLEVETALPKISPLPTGSAGAGEDATVFTLRSGVEFLFQTPKRDTYDQVNIMIVGTSDGKLQLSIYDSFVIGSFPCPALDSKTTPHMIHHASHPTVSTHALVFAEKRVEPEELHLVPMDLPFLSYSPINLSLLSSKITTLQTLLRYLKQTSLHMAVEWKNAKELPTRFIKAVQVDLEEMESGPRGIVPALYHTVLTGHAYPPLREWLVDSVAERGHKRWDKAVVSGLEGLRSLVHQNFLPALERCAIILSRLRGLARFYVDREDVGFSLPHINRALDIVSSLILAGNKVLIHTMDELQHFTAFSAWLRFQIDRLASSGAANDELTEKEATMDNSKVLTYIDRYLTRSPLDIFFNEIAKEDYDSDWSYIENGPTLLQVLDKQLKKHEAGQDCMKALPHIDFLVNYATKWSNGIFDNIAEAKRRSVRFGRPMTLSIGKPITRMDLKMYRSGRNSGIIFTALASKADLSKVHIFRSEMVIVNGISDNKPVTSCCIDLGKRALIDLKFLNETTLILFCNDSDNSPIVMSVPVHSQTLPYGAYDPAYPTNISSTDNTKGFTEFRLPSTHQTLRPVQMEVRDGNDARGQVPARICLLGSNRTTLCTLELPARKD